MSIETGNGEINPFTHIIDLNSGDFWTDGVPRPWETMRTRLLEELNTGSATTLQAFREQFGNTQAAIIATVLKKSFRATQLPTTFSEVKAFWDVMNMVRNGEVALVATGALADTNGVLQTIEQLSINHYKELAPPEHPKLHELDKFFANKPQIFRQEFIDFSRNSPNENINILLKSFYINQHISWVLDRNEQGVSELAVNHGINIKHHKIRSPHNQQEIIGTSVALVSFASLSVEQLDSFLNTVYQHAACNMLINSSDRFLGMVFGLAEDIESELFNKPVDQLHFSEIQNVVLKIYREYDDNSPEGEAVARAFHSYNEDRISEIEFQNLSESYPAFRKANPHWPESVNNLRSVNLYRAFQEYTIWRETSILGWIDQHYQEYTADNKVAGLPVDFDRQNFEQLYQNMVHWYQQIPQPEIIYDQLPDESASTFEFGSYHITDRELVLIEDYWQQNYQAYNGVFVSLEQLAQSNPSLLDQVINDVLNPPEPVDGQEIYHLGEYTLNNEQYSALGEYWARNFTMFSRTECTLEHLASRRKKTFARVMTAFLRVTAEETHPTDLSATEVTETYEGITFDSQDLATLATQLETMNISMETFKAASPTAQRAFLVALQYIEDPNSTKPSLVGPKLDSKGTIVNLPNPNDFGLDQNTTSEPKLTYILDYLKQKGISPKAWSALTKKSQQLFLEEAAGGYEYNTPEGIIEKAMRDELIYITTPPDSKFNRSIFFKTLPEELRQAIKRSHDQTFVLFKVWGDYALKVNYDRQMQKIIGNQRLDRILATVAGRANLSKVPNLEIHQLDKLISAHYRLLSVQTLLKLDSENEFNHLAQLLGINEYAGINDRHWYDTARALNQFNLQKYK